MTDKRKELITAAMFGVREFLSSTRGAAMFGAHAKVIDCDGGCLKSVHGRHGNDI